VTLLPEPERNPAMPHDHSRAAPHVLVLSALLLGGCMSAGPRAVDALPENASPDTVQLAATKDMLDALDTHAAPPPMPAVKGASALVGRGFSQVAGQPGKTLSERRLMAMRAARLDALRDLTEQIHGIRISSDSVLRDVILRNDALVAHVAGTLRGARTIAIEPRGDDGYFVQMELDADTVAYIVRAVGAGA